MAVLVIGGTGRIGSNVVRRLVLQQSDDVVVLASRPPANSPSPLTGLGERVRYVLGNVTDLAMMVNVMAKHNVTSVVHLAKLLTDQAGLRPIEALQVNVVGSANVLEAARIRNLERVVVLSSVAVMGAPDDLATPRREEDIVLPTTGIYPISNLTGEHLVHTYRKLYGVDAVAIRMGPTYGPSTPSAHETREAAQMIIAASRGEDFVRPSGSETRVDLTYQKDAAQGVVRALKWPSPLPYHVYNLSSGAHSELGSVATILQELFPKQTISLGPGLWDGVLTKGASQRDLTYRGEQRPPQDITRARTDFRYEPVWPPSRAVPDFVRWLTTFDYGTFD